MSYPSSSGDELDFLTYPSSPYTSEAYQFLDAAYAGKAEFTSVPQHQQVLDETLHYNIKQEAEVYIKQENDLFHDPSSCTLSCCVGSPDEPRSDSAADSYSSSYVSSPASSPYHVSSSSASSASSASPDIMNDAPSPLLPIDHASDDDDEDDEEDDYAMFEAAHHSSASNSPSNTKKKATKSQGKKRKSTASSDHDMFDGFDTSVLTPANLQELRTTFSNLSAAPSSSVPLSTDPQENKRQQRLQRNRASAQLSRERKKQYMRLLEKQLKELACINANLTEQVSALTQENSSLKHKLSTLSIRQQVQHRLAKKSPTGDSVQSPPLTPVTDLCSVHSDDMETRAKKLKVMPSSPLSTPSLSSTASTASTASPLRMSAPAVPSFSTARTSMLLFTLVMSVGLFYNLVGFDSPSSHLPAVTLPRPHGPARVLASIEELNVPAVKELSLEKVGVVGSFDDSESLALVPVNSKLPTPPADSLALDIYSPNSKEAAVSQFQETPQQLTRSSIEMLQQLMKSQRNNMNETDRYVYCPNAVTITRKQWEQDELLKAQREKEAQTQDELMKQLDVFNPASKSRKRKATAPLKDHSRLRRQLGLAPSNFSGASEAPLPFQVGDSLSFWIPINNQSDAHSHSTDARGPPGVMQIQCQIGSVTPIWMS